MKTQQIATQAAKNCGSIYRLAKLAGVRWQTAQGWVTGRTAPSGENLMKIIELAGKKVAVIALILCGFVLSVQAGNEHHPFTISMLGTIAYGQEYTLCEVLMVLGLGLLYMKWRSHVVDRHRHC